MGISAQFEDVLNIVNNLKSSSFNFNTSLSNSNFSTFSKNILSQLVDNPLGLSKAAYLEDLVLKVDSIKESSIAEDEKKLMLVLASSVYHTVDSDIATTFNARSKECWGRNHQTGEEGPVDCVVVGIIGGALVGTLICGFWPCGVIGGVVGGIIGSFS